MRQHAEEFLERQLACRELFQQVEHGEMPGEHLGAIACLGRLVIAGQGPQRRALRRTGGLIDQRADLAPRGGVLELDILGDHVRDPNGYTQRQVRRPRLVATDDRPGVGVEPEAVEDATDRRGPVPRQDAEVIARVVAHPLGQRQLDVARGPFGAVGPVPPLELAVGDDGHPASTVRNDARPFDRGADHLDVVGHARRSGGIGPDVEAQRPTDPPPEWAVPGSELAVEVVAPRHLRRAVDCGDAPQSASRSSISLGIGLVGRRPVAVAAAEDGVAHAPERLGAAVGPRSQSQNRAALSGGVPLYDAVTTTTAPSRGRSPAWSSSGATAVENPWARPSAAIRCAIPSAVPRLEP